MVGQYNSFYNKDNNVTISQTMPFPTVFAKEKALGNAKANQAMTLYAEKWKDVKYQLQRHYQEILFYELETKLLRQQDSLLELIEKRMLFKKEMQEITKLDFSLLTSQRKELLDKIRITIEKKSYAEKSLKLITGSQEDITADKKGEAPLVFKFEDDTSSLYSHPSIRMYSAQNEIYEKEKDLVRARSLPDISVGYVNQTLVGPYTVPGEEEVYYDNTQRFQAGMIGLGIPLFYGAYKQRKMAIQNEMNQNKLLEDYAKKQFSTEFNQQFKTYKSNLKTLEMYEQQLLPEAEIMQQQAQLQWDTGEISIIELLMTKQRILDIKRNYSNLIYEINQLVIQLNWMTQNETIEK
jgi:cobalt-zinc-cadmium resistance protein CzcA